MFRGYCADCDSRIFRGIDKELVESEQVFLALALRAASYAKWRSDVDMAATNSLAIEKYGHGDVPTCVFPPKLPADLLYRWRVSNFCIDWTMQMLRDGRTDCLNTVTIEFESRIPLRFSMAGLLTTDLRMREKSVDLEKCRLPPLLFMHLLDFDNTSRLVLSSPTYVPREIFQQFVNTLLSVALTGHLTDVLFRFMVNNNQGLAANPQFLSSLEPEQQGFLFASISANYYFGCPHSVTRLCYPPYMDFWSLCRK